MAIQDTLTEVGLAGSITTLSAPGKAVGVYNISVGSTANWPATGKTVYFAIRTINPSAVTSSNPSGLVAGTYSEWKGIVGTNAITSMQLQAGSTDQVYAAGSNTQVIIPVTAPRENALVAWGQVHADNLGNLSPTHINTQLSSLTSTQDGNATALTQRNEYFFDYIASGCVLSATAPGSTLAWSLTAGVVYIGGKRFTVSSASGTVTASKDTYFDLLDPGTGSSATLVNTGLNIAANNTASPALVASSVRLGIIVSGATNIAAATSINQGQEDRVLPLVSGVAYSVTDSIGNLITPRDPNRKILGYRQATTTQSGIATTFVQIASLSCPVNVPTARKIKITYHIPSVTAAVAFGTHYGSIWDGVVGVGTRLQENTIALPTNDTTLTNLANITAIMTATTNLKTFNAGGKNSGTGGSTTALLSTVTSPAFILVELA